MKGLNVGALLDHLPGIRRNYFSQKFPRRFVVRNAPPINDVAPQQRGNGYERFRRFADAQLDFVSVQRCITNKGQVCRFGEVLGNSTDSQRCFFVLEPSVVNPHPLPIEVHQQGGVRSGIENERDIAALSQSGEQDMPFHVGPTGDIAESSSQHTGESACAGSSR